MILAVFLLCLALSALLFKCEVARFDYPEYIDAVECREEKASKVGDLFASIRVVKKRRKAKQAIEEQEENTFVKLNLKLSAWSQKWLLKTN